MDKGTDQEEFLRFITLMMKEKEKMIPNFRDFGKIFYSLLVVEQPFSLPKLSTSDKSDYVNAIEEMGDS